MSENLSAEDEAQLARWAFGRPSTPAEVARAELAADELHRRAIVERERSDAEAARVAVAPRTLASGHGEGDDAADDDVELSWTRKELRHRQRMRATGIVGVVSAVIALGAVVEVQRQPDPDPLAIFERPASQLDEEWAERLALDLPFEVTAGPRVIDSRGNLDVIAARVSVVPDGRSTAYDAYCLYLGLVFEEGGWSITADCTYPARFDEVGLSSTISASIEGEGFDNVVWGPIGAPHVETNAPNEVADDNLNLVEWLMQPNYIALARADPFESIDQPERLLAGPKLANEAREIAGEDLTVEVFLLAGTDGRSEPDLCIHVEHPAAEPATSCKDLSTAVRNGLGLILEIDGEPWIVSVSDNGSVLADRANAPSIGSQG